MISRIAIAAAAFALLAPLPAAASPRLAARPVPAGLTAYDEPQGGRIVTGLLSAANSPDAALRRSLHRLRGYFDASPQLLGGIRSRDGRTTTLPFTATLAGERVEGLTIATYDPAGASRVVVVFDDAARFARTLRPMVARLDVLLKDSVERARPTAVKGGDAFATYEAASKGVALQQTAFPDGTATIGVAAGFRPKAMSRGNFLASADDGAYVRLYAPVPLLDPRGTTYQMERRLIANSGDRGAPPLAQTLVEWTPDPVRAWKSVLAFSARQQGGQYPDPQIAQQKPLNTADPRFHATLVRGTMSLNGTPFVFTGCVGVYGPPSAEGSWLLQITMLGAPAATAAHDMPALLAMQHSLEVDQQAVAAATMRDILAIQQQTAAWLRSNHDAYMQEREAAFERSMASARAVQDTIDRSAAGTIQYINDTAVISGPNGEHRTFDAGVASAIVDGDPQHFTHVPLNQYIRGVDY